MEEANKLIGTGKKQLVMGKVVEAVSSLQAACGLLAKTYGDTADECGEAFYWCGKALLDLARMENTVLGNALEGVPEEEEEGEEEQPKDSNVDSTENIDEKTRDELRVQVYDAMAEKEGEGAEKKAEEKQSGEEVNGTAVEKAEAAEEEKKDTEEKREAEEKQNGAEAEKIEEKTEKTETEKTETETEAQKEADGDKDEAAPDEEEEAEEEGEEDVEMEEEGDGEEQGDGAADKDSEDEEVGNLQLAWEILEVAKVIFTRTETKESQLMAAQTRLKLGEVSAESGNYTQALEDFQECLKLQEKHLEPDSRLLAETHYQLGLTYSLNLQFQQAIKALQSSISVIQSRLGNLQEVLDKAEGPEAAAEERKEMEELKALLPEIQEKVEDATEGLKTASSSAEAVKEVLDGGSTSSAFPGSAPQNGNASASSKTNGASSSSNGHASSAGVSDISHLVRKKRKTDSPVKESPVKKAKQDAAEANGEQQPHANGSSKANGDADVVVEAAMQAER